MWRSDRTGSFVSNISSRASLAKARAIFYFGVWCFPVRPVFGRVVLSSELMNELRGRILRWFVVPCC